MARQRRTKKAEGLIERCFTCKLRQRRNLARIIVSWQAAEFNFLTHDVLLRFVLWPLLVARRIKNDECKDVNVPHAVNPGEKC